MTIKAYTAKSPAGKLELSEYEPGELRSTEVEIDVDYCGLCHSDLSMLGNDWRITEFPFVPGHEVSGRIAAVGENVSHLKVGQKVGLGWFASSCGECLPCLSGDQHLCAISTATIVNRPGGFAEKVRASALWVFPLPEALDPAAVGPLFCGGITVFSPIIIRDVKPTDRVAVIGIGGLGHIALQFLDKWGCEVTAISTNPDKEEEARRLGADHFIDSKNGDLLDKAADSFDFILSTVNVELEWRKYIAALRPKGKIHLVGAAPKVQSSVFALIGKEATIGASPTGSPSNILTMLEFAARHGIAPKTEIMPMSEINEAFEKLEKESPSHRIVLQNDF